MNFRGASVSRAKSQSRTFLRQRWPPCCVTAGVHVGRHLISRVPRPWSAVIHRWIVSRDADCLHRVSSPPFFCSTGSRVRDFEISPASQFLELETRTREGSMVGLRFRSFDRSIDLASAEHGGTPFRGSFFFLSISEFCWAFVMWR